MPNSIRFHRVEFYFRDLDSKILTRDGLPFIPRSGESVALGPEIYVVKLVSYNLDYLDTDYEVWRANVIVDKEGEGDG